jgi:hypothetical protein
MGTSLQKNKGKVQEEELDSGAQPASGGRNGRMRVAGRNRAGFSLRDFWATK